MQNKWRGIGCMSGTSLDGLDICEVELTLQSDKSWHYTLLNAQTYSYPSELKQALAQAHQMDALSFMQLHKNYGKHIGKQVAAFIKKGVSAQPEYVASHGHTIFHQPAKGLTVQIGDGAAIAAHVNLPVICDFRSTDVALGGQGAPLVPIGDHLLFGHYTYCLNIGGFSNISYHENGQRVAFDISPANIVTNHYTRSIGKEFDPEGSIGRSGQLIPTLLDELNSLAFYSQKPPKSLGREWIETEFLPIIEKHSISLADKLCTVYEHVAQQIAQYVTSGKTLVTGGGAYNSFLLERIQAHAQSDIIVPDNKTVEYKEALIFAFLGALYLTDTPNCLSSVTGASKNAIGGCLYKG